MHKKPILRFILPVIGLTVTYTLTTAQHSIIHDLHLKSFTQIDCDSFLKSFAPPNNNPLKLKKFHPKKHHTHPKSPKAHNVIKLFSVTDKIKSPIFVKPFTYMPYFSENFDCKKNSNNSSSTLKLKKFHHRKHHSPKKPAIIAKQVHRQKHLNHMHPPKHHAHVKSLKLRHVSKSPYPTTGRIKLPYPTADMKSPNYGKPITYMPRFSAGPFYQTNNNTFGLYDLFLPLTFNPKTIAFVDGRYIDRGQSWEYNAGLGVRNITHSGNYLWTLYSFYDNRRTRFNNYFSQVTVGADLQTERWYFNTNGYFPVGITEGFVSDYNTAYLCQDNTRICYARGIEKSMGGWDAEVGYDFWRGLKGYVGMYVFARSGVKTAIGPNLRLQWNIEHANHKRILYFFDKIALIANWRDDQLAGSVWWAGARFDITLGPTLHYVGLERKMTSFIRRDLNVEMSSDGTGSNADITEPAKVLTNSFNDQETVVSLVSSAADLTSAITAANGVNLIGVRGTFTPAAINQQLLANQIVEGGTYSFTREGQTFSVQVGQSGTLNQVAAGSILVAGTDNTVENMSFNQAGAAAVNDAVISNPANTGVGTLTLSNNTVTGGDLIVFNAGTTTASSTISISGNTVTAGGSGAGNESIIQLTAGTAAGGLVTATITGNNFASANNNTGGIRVNGTAAAAGEGISASITDNTVNIAAGTVNQNAALALIGAAGIGGQVTATGNISGNTFTTTTAGFPTVILESNVTVIGNFSSNTLSGLPGGGDGAITLDGGLAANSQVTIQGAITNNTVTVANGGAERAAVFLSADLLASTITVNGITDNTFTMDGGAWGVATRTGAIAGNEGTVTMNGLNGNTITGFAVGSAIILNDNAPSLGTTNVVIGGTATVGSLAAIESANNLAAGSVTSPTALVNVSP